MVSYCLKCRKNTKNINPKVAKPRKEEQCFHQILQCVVGKKSRFFKEQ